MSIDTPTLVVSYDPMPRSFHSKDAPIERYTVFGYYRFGRVKCPLYSARTKEKAEQWKEENKEYFL